MYYGNPDIGKPPKNKKEEEKGYTYRFNKFVVNNSSKRGNLTET